MNARKGLLIVSVLWASLVPAAEKPRPQTKVDMELEEILVKGRKPAEIQEQLTAWLSRLVGEFRYEGYVERRGEAGAAFDRAPVQGNSQCANLGAAGLVRCQMNVRWPEMQGASAKEPGGMSWLTPAVAVYGLYVGPPARRGQAPDAQYIGHMQVDSRGLAEVGLGQLFDDTLIYKASCADLPGNCQRVVQIEAPLDGKVIRMSVEVQRDSKLEARHVFEWHRLTQTLAASDSAAPVDTRSSSIMPAAIQNWVGQLVGKYRFVSPGDEDTLMCLGSVDVAAMDLAERKKTEDRCRLIHSETECLDIGGGPGVRCVHAMGWQDTKVPVSSVLALFELWGYDPVAQSMVLASAMPVAPGMIRNLGGMTFASATASNPTMGTLPLTMLCPRGSDCASRKMQVYIQGDGRLVRYSGQLISGAGYVPYKEMKRIGDESADIPAEVPKRRNPSPRRP